MKWLKTRSTSSSGCARWKYEPLYVSRVSKEMMKDIEYKIEGMADEDSWSEHFRGIEWEIISTKQVPNKHIKEAYEGIQASIRAHKRRIKSMKEQLPLLEELQGKGRKTCPDELERARREKAFEKHMAKIKKVREESNKQKKPWGVF